MDKEDPLTGIANKSVKEFNNFRKLDISLSLDPNSGELGYNIDELATAYVNSRKKLLTEHNNNIPLSKEQLADKVHNFRNSLKEMNDNGDSVLSLREFMDFKKYEYLTPLLTASMPIETSMPIEKTEKNRLRD